MRISLTFIFSREPEYVERLACPNQTNRITPNKAPTSKLEVSEKSSYDIAGFYFYPMRYELSNYICTVFIIGTATWIAGDTPLNLAIASITLVSIAWIRLIRSALAFDDTIITVDPDNPDDAMLRGAILNCINKVEKSGRQMRLRIQTPSKFRHVRYSLSLNRDGEPSLALAGKRHITISAKGKWLADLPVPLEINAKAATVLLLSPAPGNRIRVRLPPERQLRPPVLVALMSLVLLSGFFAMYSIQTAAVTALLHSLLQQSQT